MTVAPETCDHRRLSTLAVLGDDGFRLFFPLSALHAALWPCLWIVVHGFDLPLSRTVPPGIWHAHEMLTGAFGAALIGFVTTAVPEWTDTARLRGRALYGLAALWATGRVVGLLGADALSLLGAVADLLWLTVLTVYVAACAVRRRTTRPVGFVFWLVCLAAADTAVWVGIVTGDVDLMQTAVHLVGFAFLGLLGLSLARITVPITNQVLDPTEASTPFRPHPGRLHLAPGLVAVAMIGELFGLSEAASGFLLIAAGAAFLDRVAEVFVGREAFRAELLALAGSSALAGTGLLLAGAARLGAPFPVSAGLHIAFMGGLGLGVLAVFAIAGLKHAGRPLGLSRLTKGSFLLLVAAVALRALPDLGVMPPPPGPPYALASVVWAAAFVIWVVAYWPLLSSPPTHGARTC